MRARCAIMPGLCSVGCRLVSITSPSFSVRYTIFPMPLPVDPLAVLLAVARASSCFATASRFCTTVPPTNAVHSLTYNTS